ncbi:MAG: response regulator transcription factor [Candidatus Marinimicrobia bacterium]|nr:response regulator transcription factor [Candidatus Neomarinimicrobiota bacterium]MCF7828810.1 response regulator transcription factor [Candidatus Neomarinimicrobiota bacterium]MCF7880727.1 response regulator transcription factor [Candidatus Neomarinimicrobiota bacterium]
MKIVIADDAASFRERLRDMIEAIPEVSKVIATDGGFDALRQIIVHQPELAVLDIRMPGANGYEILIEVKKRDPDIRIFIVTAFGDELNKTMAEHCGADGFYTKTGHLNEMLNKIEQLAKEKAISERDVWEEIVDESG